jgi:hypothetical protein
MSQRSSGYQRKPGDFYPTPAWVTEAILPFIPDDVRHVWEPAAGDMAMVNSLDAAGLEVFASDIHEHPDLDDCRDFFAYKQAPKGTHGILTNPPYALATEFIEHAMKLMRVPDGLVAMLLRADFDSAASRSHIFADCPVFARKIVLRKRIVWFVQADGKPKASPSFNHAWYLWDFQHRGAPALSWAA